MEMEKKLLLEKVFSDYVDVELNGDWNDLELKKLIEMWKKYRLRVSGGEVSSMGRIGMGSIIGFVKEIEWFDNILYDYNGDYRGIYSWECRDGLFEILDKVIEDVEFRDNVKKEFNEYFGGDDYWNL